ncbi:MAG TPA: phosphate signaling complex protein PhoU [Gaiellaceae bacterium]|nr:phosphate signaling complex protein PhoU [Gaiellaceae bacterium]
MSVWLEEGIAEIEALLREEALLVGRAIGATTTAFLEHDVAAADAVVASDDEIDDRYQRIEEQVQALLARQAPVAVDLRKILAMLHVNLHLERMGDYCVTVAKLARLTAGLPGDPPLEQAFAAMATRAGEILEAAVESFFAGDVEAAVGLVELDEAIDVENRNVVRRVLALGADEERHEWGLRMIVVARSLERIGDHAVDIGEQTAYMATGTFHEFTDASHPPADR